MNYDSTKHLELIQSVIGRMAGNSFLLKGWSITLVAALFALAAKDSNSLFALLAFFPAVSFWFLDAYYLLQERLFRCLYDDVCNSLSAADKQPLVPFSMDVSDYRKRAQSWFRTLWSKTVFWIHGVIVVLIAAVFAKINFF